jgi:transcriptional regulator NrdR family protein
MTCEHTSNKVVETRAGPYGWLRRRRRCDDCGARWYTVEVPESILTIEASPPCDNGGSQSDA